MTPVSSISSSSVTLPERVPSARESEIRSMRARLREMANESRMRCLEYLYSRCEQVALDEQYNDMMVDNDRYDDGRGSTNRMRNGNDNVYPRVMNPYLKKK